ncbi:putative baseplate assembly protein [Nocardia sp. bgisy134]|uniref:putative baseplate assembly protein n=1 Tax=Nocardia sp. bgisy134 TaxID=3413789 RepID=UPI003D708C7B
MTTSYSEFGCCAGRTSTPREVAQRPGLSSIEYRVGSHTDFLAGLVARLSDVGHPALAQLRSRDERDFTIALLDGVATLCDVLTFYTERLAHESYLGTAVNRTSLQELARLVAYRLRPGVASATHLAFFVQPPPATSAATGTADEAFAAGPYLPAGAVELPLGLALRSVPGPGEQPQTFEAGEAITARPEWNVLRIQATRPTVFGADTNLAYLVGTGHRLKAGDKLLFARSDASSATEWTMRTVITATELPADDRTIVTWQNRPTDTTLPAEAQLHVFRKTLRIFGHNAPHKSLIDGGQEKEDWCFDVSPNDHNVDLDGSHPDIVRGSHLILQYDTDRSTLETVGDVRELSRSEYAISATITRVCVGRSVSGFDVHVRETIVYAASELLTVAEEPDHTPLTGDLLTVEGIVELPAGRRMLLAGVGDDGNPISELVTVARTQPNGMSTDIQLTAALSLVGYRRGTAVLYGNVAVATHGETVHQILGGGDGTVGHQRFELGTGPLTYVPSTDPAGAISTLKIRVNKVEWHEVPTLYRASPEERSFVIQDTEKGRVVAVFGDGVNGARLVTGSHNVLAEYRTGIGTVGNVAAGAISQVMDPPLGLTRVTNPQPAVGGADSELADVARQAIPLTVRTLDRAVSLLDYADFARGFAGIAKAEATMLTLTGGRSIVVTVAGPDGAKVPAATRSRLVTSLRTFGDPTVSVLVLPHRAASFRLALRFRRDPDHQAAAVAAAIRAELARVFSFTARGFGLPVHRSEVYAAIHRVPGVLAVDLDRLYRVKAPKPPEPGWPTNPSHPVHRLLAARPRATAVGAPLAAELLTIASGDPFDELKEMR